MRETCPMACKLFASDLDGTLLGNPEATRRFKAAWESLATGRPLLCYASGRLIPDVLKQIEENALPSPDWIVGGVGTQIYNYEKKELVPEFTEVFSRGWDRSMVDEIVQSFPETVKQPQELQHDFKSSWYFPRAKLSEIREIRRRLKKAGLDVNIVYSSLRDLDILPRKANKGNALKWLCQKLDISLEEVLVAGDSGNDSSMFLLPGVKGIVVENAQPELLEAVVKLPVFCSSHVLADGVLEGLLHYGVIGRTPPHTVTPEEPVPRPPALARVLVESTAAPLSAEQRGMIRTGYQKGLEALRKNITPLGFSACSMADNEATGTDENYYSVWARDGAITLVSTIDLSEPDVHVAQERTLRTLFDNLSPTGQVPANVRVKGGAPDYSGVGGVGAIDSGLWAIIAFYYYINKTGNMDLLEAYAEKLQSAMNWLSAHDSNNDGLIEIPEASDWTDLFGRSYDVLYDEVLWFRANVCYGRLLEFRKEYERASYYLRLSQQIQGTLLTLFWPSTRPPAEGRQTTTFAHSQFSLGDTKYLLSEITPFGFNWRCDVLGNILAVMFNLLDVPRAQTIFQFMWGAGVNDPFPAVNLYPPVQSGDPDWKSYYVVNLLNLPYHYHNGGIWPFIGGMWVQFIQRLGLRELANQELARLAELNRAGVTHEWEFNEWAHGRTGRPMGKCFQAWSAATYLRACQEQGLAPEGETLE
ncbi:MAG: HAD-IIB family hydrolase [Armatimonadetes bacterium]|nr:HAD-IIB family hydrolase [Armatimonadota bacterium]